jgi:hypothetical protein
MNQRHGLTVVLGRTYEDAKRWAATLDEPDARAFSAHSPRALDGATVSRAYITPDARTAPSYGRALQNVRRSLLKTPGSDEDVIYLEES